MTTWYYARDGQQFGPHTEEELKGLLAEGKLAPHEHVWKAGMQSWVAAGTVFAPQLPAGGPPPPPPAVPPPAPGWGPPQGPVAQRYPPQYAQPQYGQPPYGPPAYGASPESKERIAYVLLGVFLGALGVHNFYAGYVGRGVAQLLITLFLFWLVVPLVAVWIWTIVEVITVTADAKGVPFR